MESSGRRLWRWERGPPYMAAQWVDPQRVIGNDVLYHDFSGGRRSRRGTADGRRARGLAHLILVF